jgi:hypothetical protein
MPAASMSADGRSRQQGQFTADDEPTDDVTAA